MSLIGAPIKYSHVTPKCSPMVPPFNSSFAVPQMYSLLSTQLFLQTTITPSIVNRDGNSIIEQVQHAYTGMYKDLSVNKKNYDNNHNINNYIDINNNSDSSINTKLPYSDKKAVITEIDDNDPLAHYRCLPEEYFSDPKQNKVLDPNYFIDAFCSTDQDPNDLLWLLDIDLGKPYRPTTREIASYDVQQCKIIKKDSLGVEHPGFTKCDQHFQQLLLYYYDSVVSAWYLGYIYYFGDMSVSSFKEWLSPIMDCMGLCWR